MAAFASRSYRHSEQVDDLIGRFGTLSRAENLDFPPPDSALVLPIIRPGLESPYGLLVAGLNPWHRLDDNYRSFLELVAGQVATAIGTAQAYQEELPHVFDRFHRVLSARARTHEGSGIGLALVQELVRLHGGTIKVTSTIDKGTTFTVTLPTGSAHLPPDRIAASRALTSTVEGADLYVEEASRWLSDTPGETSELALGWEREHNTILPETSQAQDDGQHAPLSARILLVDDNADMRDYLKRLLSQYYTVEAVANGAAALSIARERVPDLVLSDVMMPGLDGFELLRALRTEPQTQTVPVILLSARAGEEASLEGLRAGANDYLMKPFSARELLARVRARLEIAHMHKEAVNQEREHAMHLQKLADENAQLYQQAQVAVQDRDNLLSMVSHDLKNPLTAIKGYTQLLRRMINRTRISEKEEVVTGLTRIEAPVTRMTALINELLDLAHVHIGQSIQLKRAPTDVVKLTRQVIEEQQETTQDHSIHLETEMAELIGQFDPVRLERVITNLISNAIKYDPEGKPITVRISREDTGSSSYVILEVQDHGIGIPADDLPDIFEQFHRARNVISNMRGTGIGLASVRQVVELHGGTIHVTSQEGVGSTFRLRLPLS